MLLEFYKLLCCMQSSVILSLTVMKRESLASRFYCRTYCVFLVNWLAKWLRVTHKLSHIHFTTDMGILTLIATTEHPKNSQRPI
jgi:hypothetical protein